MPFKKKFYPTEFDKIFESMIKVYQTQSEAYAHAEIEHIKLYGHSLYANKESYRKARDRRLNRFYRQYKNQRGQQNCQPLSKNLDSHYGGAMQI